MQKSKVEKHVNVQEDSHIELMAFQDSFQVEGKKDVRVEGQKGGSKEGRKKDIEKEKKKE